MTATEIINLFKEMDNSEYHKILDYMWENHFGFNQLTDEECAILNAFREKALNLEGVDLDEYL